MLKIGDKYIHFTNYGGVNKGEVQDIHEFRERIVKKTQEHVIDDSSFSFDFQ